MALTGLWRRFMARRHRRRSFFETQDVMKRALAEEAAARRSGTSAEPGPGKNPSTADRPAGH